MLKININFLLGGVVLLEYAYVNSISQKIVYRSLQRKHNMQNIRYISVVFLIWQMRHKLQLPLESTGFKLGSTSCDLKIRISAA